jgi:hypothetical protein
MMALTAGAIAFAIKHEIHAGPRLTALAVIPVYGAVYLGLAWWTGIPELARLTSSGFARLRRSRLDGRDAEYQQLLLHLQPMWALLSRQGNHAGAV